MNGNGIIMYESDSLSHYGILGMKWGVRRYQKKDGTLTDSGKKHYKKSKRQEKLEQKYLKKGMTPKAAKQAAYNRIQKEKKAMKIAALAAGTAAVLGARHHYKYGVDRTIKSGKKLHRVTADEYDKLWDSFYATSSKRDKLKYEGMRGKQIHDTGPVLRKNKLGLLEFYKYNPQKKVINVNSDIKVASTKNAKKIFDNLEATNPAFKKHVDDLMTDSIHRKTPNLRLKIHNRYDVFNRSLYDHAPESNAFYDALKKKGYSAVQDINDMKYSHYKAKRPAIFFDTKNLSIDSIRDISSKEAKIKNAGQIAKQSVLGAAAPYVALPVLAKTGQIKNRNNAKIEYVNNYINKHPDTDKSFKEIEAMYDKQYLRNNRKRK